jgi:asparagine synthase (glutamine-hydrolysing)
MSAIAAVRAVAAPGAIAVELARVSAAGSHRGGDGSGQWLGDGIGLACQQRNDTREAALVQQPLTIDAITVVVDGRLDYRDELIAKLGAERGVESDAHLVARAYVRWRDQFVEHLEGDFAIALWDSTCRRLTIAVDHVSARPLFWAERSGRVVVGSEIRQVLSSLWVSDALNDGRIAEQLTYLIVTHDETLYNDVRRVPAGHVVVFEDGVAPNVRQYWQLSAAPRLRLSSDAAYEELFRETLADAVRQRLRSSKPIAIELSGGLDSTSVAAMAARQRDRGTALHAYTNTYSGDVDNEADAASATARHLGVPWTPLNAAVSLPTPESMTANARFWRDAPGYVIVTAALASEAAADGCGVLLNGHPGDLWFSQSSTHLMAAVRDRPLLGFALARDRLRRTPISSLARSSIRPAIERFAPDRLAMKALERTDWIEPAFLASSGLAERVRHATAVASKQSMDDRRFGALSDPAFQLHLEWIVRRGTRAGVEPRSPYADRRLAETFARMPEHTRARPGSTRHLQRAAMRGLVPDIVTNQTEKARFENPMSAFLARQGVEFLASGRLVERGWLRATAIRKAYDSYQQGQMSSFTGLHAATQLEHWLRGIEAVLG